MKNKAGRKRRYAVCGLSTRGLGHYLLPLLGRNREGGTDFSPTSEVVGIMDIDRERVAQYNQKMGTSIPYYPADKLDLMLAETRPDVLLVIGPDVTHCDHAIAGLRAGCDVIIEKPMVINCEQVRRLQAAERETGRKVQVAFNYRYTPTHQRLKRMIMAGDLGRIVNVEFTYNLDVWHGSSYFYRWNRDRQVSGGLNIHKCCHHFDLINWFLGDTPAQVFASGGLNYYGAKGALRPRDANGQPYSAVEEKRHCPIFQKYYADKYPAESSEIATGWDELKLPMSVQYPPGKQRYIYDDSIVIEDTYNAVVRYKSGTTMSYACNFCTPWEGYILGINGTRGRVEIMQHNKKDLVDASHGNNFSAHRIIFYPLFGGKQIIDVPIVAGGHGGADFAAQNDMFLGISDNSRELRLIAGSADGANAVAIGEATARSIKTGQAVDIADLLAGRLG